MQESMAGPRQAAGITMHDPTFTSGEIVMMEALNPSDPHSKRSHSHPNQHIPEEIMLIQDMRRRNTTLGLIELWHRLRGYSCCPKACTEQCVS